MKHLRGVILGSLILLALSLLGLSADAQTYEDVVLADHPVAYYRLGESSGTIAYDLSGNALHGTISSGVTLNQLGAITYDSDTAFRFNGQNGYVNVNDPGDSPLDMTGSFTVEAWFNQAYRDPSYWSYSQNIADKAFDRTHGHYMLRFLAGAPLVTGAFQFTVYFDQSPLFGEGVFACADLCPLGRWNHIVGVYDESMGALLLYLNGQLAATTAVPDRTLTANNNQPFHIGSMPLYPCCYYFNGLIDEVAVYDHALPSDRVRAHCLKGPVQPAITQFTLTPGTLANGMDVAAKVTALGSTTARLRLTGMIRDAPPIQVQWNGCSWTATISGSLVTLAAGDALTVWADVSFADGSLVTVSQPLAVARVRPPQEPGEPNAVWVDEDPLGILTGSATIVEQGPPLVARLSLNTSVWSPFGYRPMKLWPVGYPSGVPMEPAHEWSLCHDLALTNRFSPIGGPCYYATFDSSGDRASFRVEFDTASFALTLMDAAVNAARALLAENGQSIPDVSPTTIVKYADAIVYFGPFMRAGQHFQPWPSPRKLPLAVLEASWDLADIVKDRAAREILRHLIERVLQEQIGDSTFVFRSQDYIDAMAGGVLSAYKLLMILHDTAVWTVSTWNADPVIAFEAYRNPAGGLSLSSVAATPSSTVRSEGMEVRYESTALADSWGYQFTVKNLGGPSIWEVRLELDPEQPAPSAAEAPAGWSVEIGEDSDGEFVRWHTEGPGGWASGDFGSNAVPADTTLAGFGVTIPSRLNRCCFTATDAELRIGGVVLIMTPALTPAPPDFAPSEGETTGLVCSIDAAADVSLAIYRNDEPFVSLISDVPKAAGELIATWDGRGATGEVAPAGAYEARLRVTYPDGTVAAVSEPLEVVDGLLLGSLAELRRLPEDRQVRTAGQVVTASFPSRSCAYIEQPDRSAGVRVATSEALSEGDVVLVSGTMGVVDGECTIEDATVNVACNADSIRPVGLPLRAVGGKSFGLQPGVAGGSGLNNIGFLVRTWGAVTQMGEGYLYIDDGSNLKDGTSTGAVENIGVRVICDPAGYSTGEKVEVTGISSCFWTSSGIARRILTRKPEDIRKLTGP